MSKLSKDLPLNQSARYTKRDLYIASFIYPILIDLVRTCKVITYSESVEAVKAANTNYPVTATMMPVQSGRFLGVSYRFAESYGFSRISSLIINKNKGDCGAGLNQDNDCDTERLACYRF